MNAVPASRSHHAKTSNDILLERNELETRVRALEAVLQAIGDETRHALAHPQISLTTLCRIETLVRSETDENSGPPVSGLRPLRSA